MAHRIPKTCRNDDGSCKKLLKDEKMKIMIQKIFGISEHMCMGSTFHAHYAIMRMMLADLGFPPSTCNTRVRSHTWASISFKLSDSPQVWAHLGSSPPHFCYLWPPYVAISMKSYFPPQSTKRIIRS
jgi:hypothetical protein